MNIDLVAKKLVDVVDVIRAEKGPLELFGLFLRENSPDDLWDVVVAAHGLKVGDRDSYQFVGDRLREILIEPQTGCCGICRESADGGLRGFRFRVGIRVVIELEDGDRWRDRLFDSARGPVLGADRSVALAFGEHILRRHGAPACRSGFGGR